LQDLVLGTDDVVVHELACQKRITPTYGLQNLRMLPSRDFTVVTDVDGRKHDALHVTADLGNRPHDQPIAGQLRDANVKFSIRLDEVLVAGTVVGAVFDVDQTGEFLQEGLVVPAARRQFGAETLDLRPVLVHFIQFVEGQMADEVALVWHQAQQVFLLEPHHRLANRGPASPIFPGQHLFVDCLTRLEDAMNDLVP